MMKMLHVEVILNNQKKKIIRGFLNKLFKNVQMSPIHKADYFSTFDSKVCFFDVFILKSRAKFFL
eukprot:UN02292